MQKFIVLGLVITLCAAAIPVAAYAESSPPADPAVISCVKTADATREAALQGGWSTFSSSISAAYTVRASALSNAYATTTNATTTNSDIKIGVKAAWKTFRESARNARRAWRKTRTKTWKTFKNAAWSCEAPKDITSSPYSGIDVNI